MSFTGVGNSALLLMAPSSCASLDSRLSLRCSSELDYLKGIFLEDCNKIISVQRTIFYNLILHLI